MVKILALSDLHEEFEEFYPENLQVCPQGNTDREIAESPDLILCAGDITNYGLSDISYVPKSRKQTSVIPKYRRQAIALAAKWLVSCSQIAPTYYIPGNHDIGIKKTDLLKYSKVPRQMIGHPVENLYQQLKQIEFDERPCWGSPSKGTREDEREKDKTLNIFGISLCPAELDLAKKWDNMTANPQVSRACYLDYLPQFPIDILISHAPPTGKLGFCTRSQKDIGSQELRQYIEQYQPLAVICGHNHHPQARFEQIGRTRVFNAARVNMAIKLNID